MQRHEAGLRACADQNEPQDDGRENRRPLHLADAFKGVVSGGTCEQAERQQQRKRAETRHHEIDVAGLDILPDAMVRHHQRPGRERHELPRHEEREGIGGQNDEIHAREEHRIEGQHARRLGFVPAVADREQARRRCAEIDHGDEERTQRIETEMGAKPRQPDREHDFGRVEIAEEKTDGHRKRDDRDDETTGVDEERRGRKTP